jgi:hypothetical protein
LNFSKAFHSLVHLLAIKGSNIKYETSSARSKDLEISLPSIEMDDKIPSLMASSCIKDYSIAV